VKGKLKDLSQSLKCDFQNRKSWLHWVWCTHNIGLLIQQLQKRFFFLTLTRWKRLFVTFIKLVDWTKMFLHCFQLTCLTCNLVICIILK
jgi:hypothetical protein